MQTIVHKKTSIQKTHLKMSEDNRFCEFFIIKNPQCKSICDENCSSILDSARTKYTLKLILIFLHDNQLEI